LFRSFAYSGCVVFGRVAGDSAASHLLKELSTGSGALAPELRPSPLPHLKVRLTCCEDGSIWIVVERGAADNNEKTESGEKQMKEYTVEDVSKHKTKDDCWVGFRPDRHGSPLAPPGWSGRNLVTSSTWPSMMTCADGQDEKTESGEKQMKEYTVEDVSKHKTKDDCWVGFRGASARAHLWRRPGGPAGIW
jgi:hypothetical protein